MKRLLIIIPLALLAALGVLGYQWWTRSDSGSENTVRLYGNIDIRDAQLAFQDQERIAEVRVEEGDRVKAGQVLARLQTQRLNAQIRQAEAQAAAQQDVLQRLLAGTRKQEIEQAQAELNAAQVRVANAQRSYARIQKTAGAGASSQQALDDARAALDVAKAQLKVSEKSLQLAEEGPRQEDIAEARNNLQAARAALDLLQIRLSEATLEAPADGVVRSRILEPGEMADPSRPVLTLSLMDPKWVRAYVPEPQLGFLQLGMPAHVTSDSFPGQIFEGWVGFISPEAEFTPKTVETTDLRTKLVYEVRIYVHDPQDRLRLGMPVSVDIGRNGKS
jgi:multidrug resistance efflux pump